MPKPAKRGGGLVALDTETNGVDFAHGAKPFFVTTCTEAGAWRSWEWAVDPLTREPEIPPEELAQVKALIDGADELVLQNVKFDARALATVVPGLRWPWERTHDTLIAGHLLASNLPHNLTDMAVQYLGVDILPWEARLKRACTEARAWCRGHLPAWRIAKEGLPEMPSVDPQSKRQEDTPWKADSWLPRALARHLEHAKPSIDCEHDWADWTCRKCGGHRWWVILSEYADKDSETTMLLWLAMREELRRQDLWEIYKFKLRVTPPIAGMEERGASISKLRTRELQAEYGEGSARAGATMVNIAAGRGYDLKLPKGAVNDSLRDFCYGWRGYVCERCKKRFPSDGRDGDDPGNCPRCARRKRDNVGRLRWRASKNLDLPPVTNPKAKTDRPTLDGKNAVPLWLATLATGSEELAFVKNLASKRGYDTGLSYMESYERFWVGGGDHAVLHSSLNQTGTDTLRFSCHNPNLQQVSKKEETNLRYCFGPAPGREWWALDYENLELRLPGYEADERAMIELFERPDDAPFFGSWHLLNASIVYPDLFWPLADKKGEFKRRYASTWYQWIKNFDFAVQYGAVPRLGGTADKSARRDGAHFAVLEKLSGLTALNKRWIDFAKRNGYVETMPDKTVNPRRGYPLLCTRNEWGKVLETVPLSYHVQSTAMWCTCKAMVRCEERLKELTRQDPRGYHMTLQVHDEIVFDFPAGGRANLPKINMMRDLMERSGDDVGVPLKVVVNYHPNNWNKEESHLLAA